MSPCNNTSNVRQPTSPQYGVTPPAGNCPIKREDFPPRRLVASNGHSTGLAKDSEGSVDTGEANSYPVTHNVHGHHNHRRGKDREQH